MLDIDEPKVRLIDEGSGLEAVPGPFSAQVRASYPLQLFVHARH
jgi:hypothetical protein